MNKYNNPKAIGGFLVFSLLIGWMIYMSIQKVRLSNDHFYTIGYTINKRATHKGAVIDYYYIVNGVRYESSRYPDTNDIIVEGGRYFLEFLPTNPEINEILWKNQVPDYINEAPLKGWRELP